MVVYANYSGLELFSKYPTVTCTLLSRRIQANDSAILCNASSFTKGMTNRPWCDLRLPHQPRHRLSLEVLDQHGVPDWHTCCMLPIYAIALGFPVEQKVLQVVWQTLQS